MPQERRKAHLPSWGHRFERLRIYRPPRPAQRLALLLSGDGALRLVCRRGDAGITHSYHHVSRWWGQLESAYRELAALPRAPERSGRTAP